MYNDYKEAIGKVISDISVDTNVLRIEFEDGSRLIFRDEGQSCCEHRYMTCDDNYSSCIGERFDGFNLSDVERADANCEDNVHQVTFLEITTNRDHFKVVNHNEHNGYYGGFAINVYYEEPQNG